MKPQVSPEGLHIHTSPVIQVENDSDKNELRLFTESGSCYHLSYAEIDDLLLEDTRMTAETHGISLDVGNSMCKWLAVMLRSGHTINLRTV